MIKKTVLLSVWLVLSLASCQKFLDKEPDNRTNITKPEQVTALLNSAYPRANYMPFCEPMSDNAEDKGAAAQADLNNTQSYNFEDLNETGLETPAGYFHACYKAIAAANQALSYCYNADSSSFLAQRGEGLMARAYAHFMLVTLFAKAYDPITAASDMGIPYVKTVETVPFNNYDRSTVKKVYEQIEKDILEGLALIDDRIYDNAPKFHFTKTAAHAFATRFYLFKKDYLKVIEHANAVFRNGQPANFLRDQNYYATLQYADKQQLYTQPGEPANILLRETETYWGNIYASIRFGYGAQVNKMILFDPNPTGGDLAMNLYGASPLYYNFPKFSSIAGGYQVLPLLTMEEVLFNRIEANIATRAYSDALYDLNQFVSKNISNYNTASHNLTFNRLTDFYAAPRDTSGVLLKASLFFKQAAFIHEGMRWLDILRLKIPVTHTTAEGFTNQLAAEDRRRLLQLPQEVTLAGLPLNPR